MKKTTAEKIFTAMCAICCFFVALPLVACIFGGTTQFVTATASLAGYAAIAALTVIPAISLTLYCLVKEA